ncbi:MAG: bacteriocin [Hyphomicrobiales bacterium]|nr:bacteriocin [Hyphomicrobiales bacterium]
MKKLIACVLVAGSLAACNTREERTLGGGLIGAGGGALVGGLATGTAGGALAGAAIGGVGGAIIGNATTPGRRYGRRWCRDYDDFGNPVRVSC